MYLFHVAIAVCVLGAIEGNRHGNHHPDGEERQGAVGGATDQCPSPASHHCSSFGRSKHPLSCNTTVANSCKINKICCPTAPNDNHQGCCVPETRTSHAGGPMNNRSVGNSTGQGQPPKPKSSEEDPSKGDTKEENETKEEKEAGGENEAKEPAEEAEGADEAEGAGEAEGAEGADEAEAPEAEE